MDNNSSSTKRASKVLFNWDGSDVLRILGDDPTPEKFVDYVFDCMDPRYIDALLYCFGGGNTAEYESDVLEWTGEADGFVFQDDNARLRSENARKLAAMGANPPEVIVRESRKRGIKPFVSLRMNDVHDTWASHERPTFKREHPEWLLPQIRDNFLFQVSPTHAQTSLNFALPEVQELKLAIIREYLEKWDFDGIELDWTRQHNHFAPGTEYANRGYLTDFTHEVKKITESAAKKWGHPVELIPRVSETLAGCNACGYDVAQWFREDLLDGLILGDMVIDIPFLNEFRDIMCGRKVPLYPGLYGYGSGYDLWDDETVRGVAANLWAAGADGLSPYNVYPKGDFRRDLMRQIADPRNMDGMDKRYMSPRRLVMGYTRFSRHSMPAAQLPAQLDLEEIVQMLNKGTALTGTFNPSTVWATVEVADDIPALTDEGKVREIELIVGLENIKPDHRIFISLNGHSLTEQWDDEIFPHIETIVWEVRAKKGEDRPVAPGDMSSTAALQMGVDIEARLEYPGLRFHPPANWIRRGANCVQVLLAPKDKRMKEVPKGQPPIWVSRIELVTRFK